MKILFFLLLAYLSLFNWMPLSKEQDPKDVHLNTGQIVADKDARPKDCVNDSEYKQNKLREDYILTMTSIND